MEAAQRLFISSTFWTERIGPSAAIASLEIMKKERSWERISSIIGEIIQKNWKLISERQKVGIKIQGIPALSTFTFEHSDHLKFKTFLSQELLNGYLGTTAFYSIVSHSDKILVRYFQVLEKKYFYEISKNVSTGVQKLIVC